MNLEWLLFEFAALFYVKATVVLLMGILGSWLLKNYQASTRYWLWSLVLVVVVLLPLLQQLLPTWEAPIIHPPGYSSLAPAAQMAYASEPTTIESVIEISGISNRSNNLSFNYWEYFLGLGLFIWLSGAVALLAKLLADLLGLAVFSKHADTAPEHWLKILQQAKKSVGCQLKVKVGLSQMIGSPLIWGIFRPKILMPAAAIKWTDERLRTVFLHELTHASRMDHVLVLVNQVGKCMYWSNPLIWYVVHHHGMERELSCDERVVLSGKNHLEYAEELVAITRDLKKEIKYASVAMTQQQGLTARIKSIVQQKDRSLQGINLLSLKIITAASFALMVVLSTAGIVSKPAENTFQADIQTLFGRDHYLADQAAKALGKRGDQRAVPYLLKIANEYPVPHTRMQSILALGKLNDKTSLQTLVDQFSEDPSGGVRYSLIQALEPHEDLFVQQALQNIYLYDPDQGVQLRAYMSLIRQNVVLDPNPVFMQLNNPDEDVRGCAVEHTKDLCQLSKITSYMQEQGMSSCETMLINAAGDSNQTIRQDAIQGLVNLEFIPTKINQDTFLSTINDTDIRQRARLSLEELAQLNQ